MHAIRYKAHRVASHAGEGAVGYNPFARQRSRESSDVESSTPRVRADEDYGVSQTIEEELTTEPGERRSEKHSERPTESVAEDEENAVDGIERLSPPKVSDVHKVESENQSDVNGISLSRRPRRVRGIFRKESIVRQDTSTSIDSEHLDREERKRKVFKQRIPIGQQIRAMFFNNWMNLLFLVVPAGFAVNYTHQNPVVIFCINFVAIIPSSALLGFATEEASNRVGDKLGALLNMTFGNAVQLITSILLLKTRQITILKYSLLGTILTNLLLTTGLSFVCGGYNRQLQYFNAILAQTISMLLLLAVVSIVIPTASHLLTHTTQAGIVAQSRGTSIVIIISYMLWMFFQMGSHEDLFREPSKKVPKKRPARLEPGSSYRGIAAIGAGTAAASGGSVNAGALIKTTYEEEDEEEEDYDPPSLDRVMIVVAMIISITLVAFNTQFATDSIQGLLQKHGLSQSFLGLVILPILSIDTLSIFMAMKDKMDVSIELTLERCMQTSLLIVPLVVLLAWIMGIDEMTLQFDGFSIAALFVSIIVVTYVISEGKSNWLTGALLIKVFIIIALSAYYIHDETT